MWASQVNIHCIGENASYGNFDVQDAPMIADKDVLFWEDVNLADWYFKNTTPGSNTKIVIAGTKMSDARKEELGLI